VRSGGGLNGGFVLDETTVQADEAIDQLLSGDGLDWTWAETIDNVFAEIIDRNDT
jgi:hypothetical protein